MKITDLNLLGRLPDMFTFINGKRVENVKDWEMRRNEIYKNAVELQYGTMPPPPEFLKIEPLYLGGYGKINSYRITTGKREFPVSFMLQIHMPDKNKAGQKNPIIIDGDGCFPYMHDSMMIEAVREAGMCLAVFNRTELAPDIREAGRCGQLYDAYPNYTFGALGAWAWGYSRCVDAILNFEFIDAGNIAFTGHSRGGKTALLAGALDTRAKFVNPNGSGAGGAGCFRVHMSAMVSDGKEKRSEMLNDLWAKVDFWFGPELGKFKDNESELPFDEHMLKALVAPRILLCTEAEDDIWANPVGTYLTSVTAREVWQLYGCGENLLWHWRQGVHFHTVQDLKMLLNLMCNHINGDQLSGEFFNIPFDPQVLI